MTAHPRRAGVPLALFCLCLLGAMPLVANSRPEGSSALGFAAFLTLWQFLLSAPVAALEYRFGTPGILAPGTSAATRRRTLVVILGTGGLFGVSTLCYVAAVRFAGSITAAIAIQAYPLFAILLEWLLLGRHKTKPELAVTVFLVAVLYFLGTNGTWRVEGISLWFLLALCVPLIWSVAHITIKESMASSPITPIQITCLRSLASTAILMVPLVLTEDPARILDEATRSPYLWSAMAMGTIYYVELIAWFHAVRSISISLASSIAAPWPALTLALAVLFLGEAVRPYQVLAMIAVMASVWALIVLSRRG